MAEGATRYLLELIRAEPTVWGTPLSLSMWISIFLVIGGIVMWFICGRMGAERNQPAPTLPRPAMA